MFPPSDGGGNVTSELGPELRRKIENTIRFLAVDAVRARPAAGTPARRWASRAPPSSSGTTTCASTRRDPAWPLRDRFVLSNGHASMLLYSLLHLYGFDLSLDEI